MASGDHFLALTSLPNRSMLIERLAQLPSMPGQARPAINARDDVHVLLLLNLDRFTNFK